MSAQFSTLTNDCNLAKLFSWLNSHMPTLQERLTEIMEAKSWDYAELVRVSGESRSVVSQWLGRSTKTIKSIGKLQAAERIERESGYAALWVAKGLGPKLANEPNASGGPATALIPSNPGPRYLVQRLGELLAPLDSTDRKSAGAILHDLAIAPEYASTMADKLERLLGGAAPQADLLTRKM